MGVTQDIGPSCPGAMQTQQNQRANLSQTKIQIVHSIHIQAIGCVDRAMHGVKLGIGRSNLRSSQRVLFIYRHGRHEWANWMGGNGLVLSVSSPTAQAEAYSVLGSAWQLPSIEPGDELPLMPPSGCARAVRRGRIRS